MGKKTGFFSSKAFLLALVVFFAVLSLILACVLTAYTTRREVDIVGSFYTANAPGARYFVFTADGEYYQYRQLEAAKKGTYTKGGNIITLDGDAKSEYAIQCDTHIYYFDTQENLVVTYEKFSDIPNFINVLEDEGK